MTLIKNSIVIFLSTIFLISCTEQKDMEYTEDRGFEVNERSYQLGMLSGFGEFVKGGIKPLSVSTSFSSSDMDIIYPDLEIVAKRLGIKVYRETSPMETDLFPFSRDEIVIFYMGDVLDQYLAVKARKQALLDNDQYVGEARRQIAYDFGKLMGYSDEGIEQFLSSSE
ncbi:hypothetical protein [Pseudemcibacter aquimaris]|uniref:hypothetical protein n=1 Tax=Pseudemcibacter aquimaris TaxID=2857064 RepID=UPI0020115A46|nr:hypothetical protein [Pseudemcibacter aquimaris]MCC3860810.1 hypothetical protein [Pseudemcibacter aquimaris]WDU59630.1 hypothetical protein KW060_05065 [Pseudemcibacter aquimaris]